MFLSFFKKMDWFLILSAVLISLLGLVTMKSFSAENVFFDRQIIWIAMAVAVFFIAAMFDYSFLRRSQVLMLLFTAVCGLLLLVLSFGALVKGATNRFNFGLFSLQPADPAKLILVALLAKYFARRHIEIKSIRHIVVSGAYAFVLQPDIGSGIIIFFIWLGMVIVAGISLRHLAILFAIGVILFGGLWHWGLKPYQKQRILTFVHPQQDIRGAGYNAYQSMVAVGSGELLGKGVGYGTQSKLRFLPEFQTDFIFASFAEEWGFAGVILLFGLYGLLISRILLVASHGTNNFEKLFAVGIAVYVIAQFIVHAGMNLGLFPITGTTLPFMSYGGSHLLTEYLALGILISFSRRGEKSHPQNVELLGAH